MSTWGTGPWGLGTFGGLPGPLSVVSALAITTRTVRVTLTSTPLAASATVPGDALNPATWTVTRLDTGFMFTVASVDQVDAITFDIFLVQALGPASTQHQVSSTTLKKPTGALISSPYSALFNGLVASQPTSVAIVRQRDLANPPAPPGLNSIGGTLVMDASGDYKLVSGAALLKKLILRRLTTRPGEFAHLPNYGLGFAVKEPLRDSDLIALRGDVEAQVLLEPDVATANVLLSFNNAEGIVVCRIRATMRSTGETVDTSMELPGA